MGRYDTIEVNKTGARWAWAVLVCGLAAAGGWWYWQAAEEAQDRPQIRELPVPPVPVPAGRQSPAADAGENPPAGAPAADAAQAAEGNLPEAPAELPALPSSDPGFRETLLGLSAGLAPWLDTQGLLRKVLTVVNDLSQGQRLQKHLWFLPQQHPFTAVQSSSRTIMAHSGYHRYDALAAAVGAVDAGKAVAVYRKFKPLLQQVYDEFGYPPDRPLEDIFLKAAAQVLAAPQVDTPVALVRPSVLYKFADERLEKSSPVVKQMLRMGPENTRIIQDKVRQLVEALVNTRE